MHASLQITQKSKQYLKNQVEHTLLSDDVGDI